MDNSWARRVVEWVLALISVVIVAAILFPLFARPRMSMPPSCLSNVKQIVLDCIMYSYDYDNLMPKGKQWMDVLTPYTRNENIFHDTNAVKPGEYGYAFRDLASGKDQSKVKEPEKYELIFDSTLLYRNAYSGLWSLPSPGRHSGNDSIGFLDGHAKRRTVP